MDNNNPQKTEDTPVRETYTQICCGKVRPSEVHGLPCTCGAYTKSHTPVCTCNSESDWRAVDEKGVDCGFEDVESEVIVLPYPGYAKKDLTVILHTDSIEIIPKQSQELFVISELYTNDEELPTEEAVSIELEGKVLKTVNYLHGLLVITLGKYSPQTIDIQNM